jgi:hypothetical protein
MLNSSGGKDLRGTSQIKRKIFGLENIRIKMTFASRSTCFIFYV